LPVILVELVEDKLIVDGEKARGTGKKGDDRRVLER